MNVFFIMIQTNKWIITSINNIFSFSERQHHACLFNVVMTFGFDYSNLSNVSNVFIYVFMHIFKLWNKYFLQLLKQKQVNTCTMYIC